MNETQHSIRLAIPQDGPRLAEIYRPYVEETAISFEYDPPDAAQMAARIAQTLEVYPYLVYVRGDVVQGYACASRHRARPAYDWNAELSVYLAREACGQGGGRALYGVLLELLSLQNVYTVYAGITPPNDASLGLHRALGFTDAGYWHATGYKHGAWHDVQFLQLQLKPPPSPPEAFVPFAQVDSAEIAKVLKSAGLNAKK